MRWTFSDKYYQEEQRENILMLIDNWWSEFDKKQPDIISLFRKEKNWDLPAWVQENLQKIDPNLMWEFGPGIEKDYRLVITPEQNTYLRPLVNNILEKAPITENWEFFSYRLVENFDQAVQVVKGRTGRDINELEFQIFRGEDNQIDLTFCSAYCKSINDQNVLTTAFLATETLLGEKILDQWIGNIEIIPKPRGIKRLFAQNKPKFLPLNKLFLTVEEHINSIRENLPKVYYWQINESKGERSINKKNANGAVFQLKPKKMNDYPGSSDLFVASTAYSSLWQAQHSPRPFYSCRFSNFEEMFCYLKTDGTVALDGERFKDRMSIEEALDDALIPNKMGCVTGGGTGLKYSYIDLAISDIKGAIPIIRDVLRNGRITKRTWLLFYDSDLQDEWVGIYEDTPSPPILIKE